MLHFLLGSFRRSLGCTSHDGSRIPNDAGVMLVLTTVILVVVMRRGCFIVGPVVVPAAVTCVAYVNVVNTTTAAAMAVAFVSIAVA